MASPYWKTHTLLKFGPPSEISPKTASVGGFGFVFTPYSSPDSRLSVSSGARVISFFSDMLNGFVSPSSRYSTEVCGREDEQRASPCFLRAEKVWGISSLFLNRFPPTTLRVTPGAEVGVSLDLSLRIRERAMPGRWKEIHPQLGGSHACLTYLPACRLVVESAPYVHRGWRTCTHNKAALTSAISRRFDGSGPRFSLSAWVLAPVHTRSIR